MCLNVASGLKPHYIAQRSSRSIRYDFKPSERSPLSAARRNVPHLHLCPRKHAGAGAAKPGNRDSERRVAVDKKRIVTECVSGSVAAHERKGFAKLLDRLEDGDVLLVTKLDRLGRNAMDVRATVEHLARIGVRVHCLALGGVDLTSSAGKMTMAKNDRANYRYWETCAATPVAATYPDENFPVTESLHAKGLEIVAEYPTVESYVGTRRCRPPIIGTKIIW